MIINGCLEIYMRGRQKKIFNDKGLLDVEDGLILMPKGAE